RHPPRRRPGRRRRKKSFARSFRRRSNASAIRRSSRPFHRLSITPLTIFDVHKLERPKAEGGYGKDIKIPDKAFEAIFDYFDDWDWVLDPERTVKKPGDKEQINPDVLGYIFEKYINQKQMGAYYTKEDITEYISTYTVLPFLFDAARAKCKVAFENPDGPTVWDLLRENPDRYIYPAVRHGITWDIHAKKPLEKPLSLPLEIAAGLDATKPNLIERRKPWNKPAPADYALSTEIWREVVARRQRYEEVRQKLAAGEVREVNDFITLNLDLRQFAQDVIARCDSLELLAAIWHTLAGFVPDAKSTRKSQPALTILDPTCGSGAFLFAALNILEPLYEACLDRMDAMLCEALTEQPPEKRKLSPAGHPVLPHGKMAEFTGVLDRARDRKRHPNERYFIYKTIILRNLYGVDLMEEAVEICKLRLFLKLAAQVEPDTDDKNLGIEPLPDIDFNVRAGNTLVGYATRAELEAVAQYDNLLLKAEVKQVLEASENAAHAFKTFVQVQEDGDNPAKFKRELDDRLKDARVKCDRFLAESYFGGKPTQKEFDNWKQSHQPFHWFVEFFGILNGGGFDVIIGNPPYVDYTKVQGVYRVPDSAFTTLECGNLYALAVERSLRLTKGRYGFILPLSSTNANGNATFQTQIRKTPCLHISHFAVRPSKLFNGVDMNLTIVLGGQQGKTCHSTSTFRRWPSVFREQLFATLQYVTHETQIKLSAFPKFGNAEEIGVWTKLRKIANHINRYTGGGPVTSLAFHGFGRYWRKCITEKLSDNYQEFSILKELAPFTICVLNSQLAYWYWIVGSDCYRFTKTDALNLPVPDGAKDVKFKNLSERLLDSYEENSVIQKKVARNGKVTAEKQFFPVQSKPILDEIDTVLACHYGFTAEELDFILNYDIKYRLGRSTETEEE
ncbi:MAG: Eco57I restriction-modification methylase domain-containing protein, partial [Verrucomicrobia bacterium]|nr:Eco57I restriction-modification methylase domain-containing protein [Verrucomicrobiota bacterium]